MIRSEVERLLDAGFRLGVTKPVDSPDYLGWVLVSQHRPSPRLKSILDPAEHSELLEEQRQREVAPYLILNLELRRSVHESGDYETEEDYRMKTKTWCRDINEVQAALQKLGVELSQLCEAREIGAP
jgi:hypothetical protein